MASLRALVSGTVSPLWVADVMSLGGWPMSARTPTATSHGMLKDGSKDVFLGFFHFSRKKEASPKTRSKNNSSSIEEKLKINST